MKASDWISVDERLPEVVRWIPITESIYSDKILFITERNHPYVGWYSKPTNKKESPYFLSNESVHLDITHWMPIVEPSHSKSTTECGRSKSTTRKKKDD